MSSGRFARVCRILLAESPYRVDDRRLRQLLAVLPKPRRKFRRAHDRLVAALVALPYRLGPADTPEP